MATEKAPAILVVVIKTAQQQWFVAGILNDGTIETLVRSEPGNLDDYVGLGDDEQLSFLRHRLAGAIQRGFDRLFGKQAKATRIVLVADGQFCDADSGLLSRLADHFHLWMSRPTVTCYCAVSDRSIEDVGSMQCLVGRPDESQEQLLAETMPGLAKALADDDRWEVIPKPPV